MEHVLPIIEYLKTRLHFRDGLIVIVAASASLYWAIAEKLGTIVASICNDFGWPVPLVVCRCLYILGLLLASGLPWLYWQRIRRVPRFANGEMGIFFAPNTSPAAKETMERLFVQLDQEIRASQLNIRFSLKTLPPNIAVNSDDEAIHILHVARGNVAIWGPVEQQESDKGKITGFSKLSFTWVHTRAAVPMARHEAVASSLIGRKLHIDHRVQIADQAIVAKDIGIVVRNILGVSLLIDRRYKDSLLILDPLRRELGQKFPNKQPIAVKQFRDQLNFDCAYTRSMSAFTDYSTWLYNDRLYSIPPNLLHGWINLINQAIGLDTQNSMHYVSKAIFLFLLGETGDAIRAELKAAKLAPAASAEPNIGLAFLYAFVGDYRRSREQYRLGLAKKTASREDMITQCIAFISQALVQFPDKQQLLLGLGLLYYHRGESDRARESFQALISSTPSPTSSIAAFVNEAKRLLPALAPPNM